MKITLLVEKEKVDEKDTDIIKKILIPFINTLSDELKEKAGIWTVPPQDFDRTSSCIVSTDAERGYGPTFIGEDGFLEYNIKEDKSFWTQCSDLNL